jgi:hypothetical protein
MTKTEFQTALAAATQTNKRTAALFLETLSSLAYKGVKKEGEFVLPALESWSSRREKHVPELTRRRERRSKFRPKRSLNSGWRKPQRMRF